MKLTLATNVIKLLNSWYLRVPNGDAAIADWSQRMAKWLSTRGNIDTIKRVKATRLACTKYLCGEPLDRSAHLGIGLMECGLPKCGLLTDLIRSGDSNSIRLALTLLGMSRLIKGWGAPDLDPITTPTTSVIPPEMEVEVGAVVKDLGLVCGVPLWERPHLTTKMGPNGLALAGAIWDLCFLPQEVKDDVLFLGGEKLGSLMDIPLWMLDVWTSLFPGEPKGLCRKLAVIRDKEAKSRIIATADYWTQTCLYPLHKAVFALLRGIKSDCTFNQGSFRKKLAGKSIYFSIDLSNATDRFPALLQRTVVASITGSGAYADAWLRLMTGQPFYVPWKDAYVKYMAGQPMGLYSSWAVFSLSHHIIVQIAARRVGKGPIFLGYALLGDDIVICDEAVAKEYRNILTTLGVETSPNKSHTSKHMCEFAKRWIYHSEEVSPAPLTNFLSGTKYYLLAQAVREVEERWLPKFYTMASRGLFVAVIGLYPRAPGLVQRLADKAYAFFNLPVSGEGKKRREEKATIMGSTSLAGLWGCSAKPASMVQSYYELLAFAKLSMIRETIKQQVDLFNTYLRMVATSSLLPPGMDAQSVLTALLPIQVILHHVRDLQLDVNRLGSLLQASAFERVALFEAVHLGIDPNRLNQNRASHLVILNNAASLNRAKMNWKVFLADRHQAMYSPEWIAPYKEKYLA